MLSKNQMDVGMLPTNVSPQLAEQVFAMLLYQNSGQYYSKNATVSALDSDIAVQAFKEYCKFYTDYRLDRKLRWISGLEREKHPLSLQTILYITSFRYQHPISRVYGIYNGSGYGERGWKC